MKALGQNARRGAIGVTAAALALLSACKFRDEPASVAVGLDGGAPEGEIIRAPAAGGAAAAVAPPAPPPPLSLTVDPKSGRIEANLRSATLGLEPKQKIRLAYGARVVKDVAAPIDCATLKTTRTHVVGGGDAETVRLFLPPAQLASPFRPHPHGDAKADMAAIARGHLLRLEVCVAPVGDGEPLARAWRNVHGLNGDQPAIHAYGKVCAEQLGALPPLDCMDDSVFKTLPVRVTREGGTTEATTSVDQCDTPSYLPTGDARHCKPGARLARISVKGPTGEIRSEAAVLCRRYHLKSSASEAHVFDDIAVIQHDHKSGATCFFQALGHVDGRQVVPPTEPAAESFWLAPRDTAAIGCIGCHDADPFLHTPYVDQVKNAEGDPLVPSRPFAKYVVLGDGHGFERWPPSFALKPESGEDCVTCHRSGSLQGCETWSGDATGVDLYAAPSRTLKGRTFPATHWMPPSHVDYGIETPSQWHDAFKTASDAFRRCCTLRDAKGKRILGVSSRFGAAARYPADGPDAEQRAALKAAGCWLAPITERR